jgi:hypothetical protein
MAAKLRRVHCVCCKVKHCKVFYIFIRYSYKVVRCSSSKICSDVNVLACKMCRVRIIP